VTPDRAQIHQVADACLFAASFWIAFALRTNPQVVAWLNLDPTPTPERCRLALLPLIVGAPLILESQGFYDGPPLAAAGHSLAALQGCLITTIGLVLVMYTLHFVSPRVVMMFFGVISFTLII